MLRWGISNESNNRAFAPGTFNFFSAGVLPDPGRGGVQIRPGPVAPAVRCRRGREVERHAPGGRRPGPASAPTAAGAPLGAPTDGTLQQPHVRVRCRHRHRRPGAGTAHLAWDGDVTRPLLLRDVVLPTSPTRSSTSPTAGARSPPPSAATPPRRTTPTSGRRWPPQRVTLADLPQVDLSGARVRATPAYPGVRVAACPQVTDGRRGVVPAVVRRLPRPAGRGARSGTPAAPHRRVQGGAAADRRPRRCGPVVAPADDADDDAEAGRGAQLRGAAAHPGAAGPGPRRLAYLPRSSLPRLSPWRRRPPPRPTPC